MEIECIYEKGVLKPLKKIKLREGEKVRVSIKPDILKYAGIFKNIDKKEVEKIIKEIESRS